MTRPEHLPPHLAERTRILADRPTPPGARVLVWLRAALRSHENPAIDVGLEAGRRLGLPVLVYQGLSERYPYASLRHHHFILEGARDLAIGLRERGVDYALHVEGPGGREPVLLQLGGSSCLIVLDDMPLDPLRRWAATLAARVEAPIWAVDAARVVPRSVIRGRHPRAFAFRDAIADEVAWRVRSGWTDAASTGSRPDLPLPFVPVDPVSTDLADLASRCAVDPTVGPGLLTGGQRAAQARWSAFVRSGDLRRYARDRNDPIRSGVSRMSAYLHYGMIAATRMAREAAAHGGEGAEKYLDELITWRELAWSYAEDHDVTSIEALPAFARETLRQHRDDPREVLPIEDLWRGATPDPWWNVAQKLLASTGELHNNARMTWGKAVPAWTPTPEAALATLEDLNHRYALDGRDPSSYGGILWCLGLFDRPFSPEAPVLGTVRPRDTGEHARRLPAEVWWQKASPKRPTAMVIGAGPSGAWCARVLADHGVEVTVLDKSRGAGGRTATRRLEGGSADHGAPCFAALPPPLRRHQQAWEALGLLRRWEGPFVQRTTGGDVPLNPPPRWIVHGGSSALARHLLRDLRPRWGCTVTKVTQEGGRWVAWSDETIVAEADTCVVAVPAPQARALLEDARPALAARLAAVRYDPAWVLLGTWATAPFSAGLLHLPADDTLELVVREASKPGRSGDPGVVVHGSAAWSRANLEIKPEAAAEALIQALAAHDLPAPAGAGAHRWRFARVIEPMGPSHLWEDGLGLCGDGVAGDGVHRALASGAALAGRMLADPRFRRGPDVTLL